MTNRSARALPRILRVTRAMLPLLAAGIFALATAPADAATISCTRVPISGFLVCDGVPKQGDTVEVDWVRPECEFTIDVTKVEPLAGGFISIQGTITKTKGAACPGLGFVVGGVREFTIKTAGRGRMNEQSDGQPGTTPSTLPDGASCPTPESVKSATSNGCNS